MVDIEAVVEEVVGSEQAGLDFGEVMDSEQEDLDSEEVTVWKGKVGSETVHFVRKVSVCSWMPDLGEEVQAMDRYPLMKPY